jgi:sulfite exporter TauE/SafE
VIVFALYLILKYTGLLTFSPNVEGPTNMGAVFVIGLVAAFSSCTAVVAGLVTAVSASAAKKHPDATFARRIRPHILFNVGRLIGFAVFGAAIGAIGQAFTLSTNLNAVLVMVVAVLMIGLGINLLDVIPKKFSIQAPKWLAKRIMRMSESEHPIVALALGAATFFLPCGFTQSMQLYALSTGDPALAAVTLFVFALGTLPALLGIGAVTAASRGNALKKITQAAGAVVLVLGIANVQNSVALFGWSFSSGAKVVETSEVIMEDGRQVIQMEVTPYGVYNPDTLVVVEDVPVKWEIWGADSMGCASTLVLNAFGVQERLQPGFNEVEFTPTKSGKYTFTCSMGMVRGTMIVEAKS